MAETDEILSRVSAIHERIAARAADSEQARRLDPDSIAAMREAGIFRLLAPRRYGGYEATLRTQMEATAVIAHAYPAAGWLQVVLGGHTWILGSFPEKCQDEVFGDGPDVRIPGTLAAQGKAVTVDGGWRLSGRWQFCSGVDHGDWLLIGALADHLPQTPDRSLHVVVPRAEVVVDDTWFSLGLRGTGSKDIVARDAFVPAHRAMPSRMLFEGRSPHAALHATGLYRLPVLSGLGLQLGGAVLGMARRALELHVERTRTRREVYTKNAKSEHAGTQSRIAESAAEVLSAELLLGRAWRTGSSGSPPAAIRQPSRSEASSNGMPLMPSSFAVAPRNGCSRPPAPTRSTTRAGFKPCSATSTRLAITPRSTSTAPPRCSAA